MSMPVTASRGCEGPPQASLVNVMLRSSTGAAQGLGRQPGQAHNGGKADGQHQALQAVANEFDQELKLFLELRRVYRLLSA